MQVSDISGIVAEGLQRRGIAAEARKDVKPAYLRDDEVLLSGAVLSQEREVDMGRLLGAALFSSLSLTLLPTPIPFREGNALVYRVELTDRRGRILYQSGEQRIVGTFDTYHFYGTTGVSQKAPRVLTDELTAKVGQVLQDQLAAAGASTAASFAAAEPSAEEPPLSPDLEEAFRLLGQSQAEQDEGKHDDAVLHAEKALDLAEAGIAGRDDLTLEAFIANVGMQYAGRARASRPTNLADLEKARPYFERAYEIRARELGRDDERTRQLEKFMVSVWGTDSVRRALSH